MERTEAAGLGLAVVGHALLLGALSVVWLSKSAPQPRAAPVEVTLADEVGLESAQRTPAADTPAPSSGPSEEENR